MHVGVNAEDLSQQREPVHLGHVDIRNHHGEARFLLQTFESFNAVIRKHQLVATGPDIPPQTLTEQGLHVRLVVDHQDLVGLLQHVTSAGNRPGSAPKVGPGLLTRGAGSSAAEGSQGVGHRFMHRNYLVEPANLEYLAHWI